MDKISVLLVDDEEELVFTLAERLVYRGYDAEGVLSGAEAITRAEEKRFDVIVIDVKMPGMNGIEVMKKIRQKHPNTRVMLITGHGSIKDGEDGLAEGAVDYLQKPVKLEDLIKKIRLAVGISDEESDE